MRTVDFDVVIERDSDGTYIAEVPVLPGCHSQGATQAEALERIHEAIEGYLRFFGKPTSSFVGMKRIHVDA